ncbi:MAG: lipid A deacylase LpxR family protein, partial [Pseudomonadota bacterium]
MSGSRFELLIAAALITSSVWAETDQAATGLWVAEYENDIFAGEDRYYTSGVRLTRVGQTRNPPSWLESVARRFPGFNEADTLPYSLSISHNIFTPADIEEPGLPPDDRLYAGWLNVEFKTGTVQARGADRIRVGLGIAGPAAGGKQIQKAVHRLIGAPRPVGWSEQLENEPTFLLGYDRLRRINPLETPTGRRFDASYFGGMTLGNAYTHASIGGFLRWGQGLRNDYGPPRITPAVSGSAFFKPGGRTWYLFLGTEGRAIGRDLFIEGNTFGGRDGVDAERLVGELFAGFVFSEGPFR